MSAIDFNKVLFIICATVFALQVNAQPNIEKEQQLTRILFVMDGSQSMLTKWESGTKMNVAQRLLNSMVDSLKNLDHVQMALRVYGHQSPVPPQDCGDTKLEVPFSKNNVHKIKQKLNSIKPKGTTPIAYSLELSADDFPSEAGVRNIIILITDGIESCDGDPCAVSQNLQKKGVILKPFVIGVGLDVGFKETFECVGRYYDANNEDRFKEVLEVVVSQALNTTSLQVDLLDSDGEPKETNVNMTFYDSYSNEIRYNFIHTLNQFGRSDTLRLDPIPTYRIQVHTIPEITKQDVVLEPGKHNIVSVSAPQGKIMVKTQKSGYYKNLQFVIRDVNTGQTLNVQGVDKEEKYLVGKYDLELFTIPRMVVEDLEVKQSETTVLQIPKPGLITFIGSAQAYGAIYKVEGYDLIWVKNLDSSVLVQTIAIQPGEYQVISRPRNAIESVFTSNKTFKVISGQADKIILF